MAQKYGNWGGTIENQSWTKGTAEHNMGGKAHHFRFHGKGAVMGTCQVAGLAALVDKTRDSHLSNILGMHTKDSSVQLRDRGRKGDRLGCGCVSYGRIG